MSETPSLKIPDFKDLIEEINQCTEDDCSYHGAVRELKENLIGEDMSKKAVNAAIDSFRKRTLEQNVVSARLAGIIAKMKKRLEESGIVYKTEEEVEKAWIAIAEETSGQILEVLKAPNLKIALHKDILTSDEIKAEMERMASSMAATVAEALLRHPSVLRAQMVEKLQEVAAANPPIGLKVLQNSLTGRGPLRRQIFEPGNSAGGRNRRRGGKSAETEAQEKDTLKAQIEDSPTDPGDDSRNGS